MAESFPAEVASGGSEGKEGEKLMRGGVCLDVDGYSKGYCEGLYWYSVC